MTPARARRAAHLKLIVSNPDPSKKEPSDVPMILFFSLPFILATAAFDGCMDAFLGPLPEKL